MASDVPEPLWRVVVGETEPWRRGRLFLILLAIWQFLSQIVLLGSQVIHGSLEAIVSLVLWSLIFWLSFYFIWIGVHWVRWISGGFSCLVGFAKIIWGWRDGSALFVLDGTIGLCLGSYLALAPSIYFFALRQKAQVRWKENLAVAAVFALLLLSAGTTLVALQVYKSHLERTANDFGDRTFRRIFVDGDSEFLRSHATRRLMEEAGWDRLSYFMADCYMRLGRAQNLEHAHGRLRFRYVFPATLVTEGVVSAKAQSRGGPVVFQARIGTAGGEWEIDAIYWQFALEK